MEPPGRVKICGINTAELKTLSEPEKQRLLVLAKKGRKDARDKLIKGNLKLILSVIQRFTGRNENIEDLFQTGCVGLIKAINNFDTSLNVCFSTYAVPMIIGEIRRVLRDNNPIKISRSVRETAGKAIRVREKLTMEKDRAPTTEEIAEEIGESNENVVLALESMADPLSLQEPVVSENGDGMCIMDQVGDENSDINWVNEISIKQAVKKLNPKEKNVLSLRFLKGKTQVEVAKQIGTSQAHISRLEKIAIKKIKPEED